MQSYTRNRQQYQQAQIQSADPMQLVILSYEGALSHIAGARRAIESGDIEARTVHINRACAIVANLQGALDKQRGGDIAASLDRLYTYFTRRMCEANINNDAQSLEECQRHLSTLWSAWREVFEKSAAAGEGAAASRPMSVALRG